MKLTISTLFIALLLTACAGKTPILTTPPAACAELLPNSWKTPVEAAAIPVAPDSSLAPLDRAIASAKAWAAAFVRSDAQLEKANARTADVIYIVRRCEERANEARQPSK
jgi:hypothetical protein